MTGKQNLLNAALLLGAMIQCNMRGFGLRLLARPRSPWNTTCLRDIAMG